MKQFHFSDKWLTTTTKDKIPFGINRTRSSLEGRARARRTFDHLLNARQRFCLKYLGRYSLRGPSGVVFHIEVDWNSRHQWFYLKYGPRPSESYYFSLVAVTDWHTPLLTDVYLNLMTIHLNLMADDRHALNVANWDYYPDKSRWIDAGQPMPPSLTPPARRQFFSFRSYRRWRRSNNANTYP